MTSICQKYGWAGITAMINVAAFVFIFSYPVDIKKEKCPSLPPEVHTHQESYRPPFLKTIVENNTATMITTGRF